MFKSLTLFVAAGTMSMLLIGSAASMPLAQGKTPIIQSSDITLVRDNCGRGMRYSNSQGRCVAQRDAVRSGRGCGPGWRWSNGRGRCVRD
jgi:hypothetical protein